MACWEKLLRYVATHILSSLSICAWLKTRYVWQLDILKYIYISKIFGYFTHTDDLSALGEKIHIRENSFDQIGDGQGPTHDQVTGPRVPGTR